MILLFKNKRGLNGYLQNCLCQLPFMKKLERKYQIVPRHVNFEYTINFILYFCILQIITRYS